MPVLSPTTTNIYQNLSASTSKSATSTSSQDNDYKGKLGGAIGGPTSATQQQIALSNLALGPANPDFHPSIWGSSSRVAPTGTISRGYIRRANPGGASDPTAGYKLRFMYNPEAIQRSYISYLDQQAIDPFNSLNGSENSTMAPGILDFNFQLVFDRQIEAQQVSNDEGCLVDLKYFDLVVRGVLPTTQAGVPDSGIMMVNPRDIVVVFSNDLQVRGRPYNASITYERFTHKMTPTRVTVNIAIKAMYVGPTPPSYDLPSETETRHSSVIQYENTVKAKEAAVTVEDGTALILELVKSSGYSVSDLKSGGSSSGAVGSGGGGGLVGSVGGGGTGSTAFDMERVLKTIRTLESGGNYQAVGPGGAATGAYQFIDSTWRANGGTTAKAYLATPEEQDRVARNHVNAIMGGSTDVRKVPGYWYYPAWWDNPEKWDQVPAPGAGNRLTYRQYIDKWMATYTSV